MDLGTGKLPVSGDYQIKKHHNYWSINNVSVWGYDLVTPEKYFSSYDFGEFALKKIKKIQEDKKIPLLVGGTGFYIDTVTGRTKPSAVLPDFDLRKELENISLEALQKRLAGINPKEYKKIDKNNPRRLIRAIEKTLGKEKREKKPDYLTEREFIIIGLAAERKTLYSRADSWLEKVWQLGLIEETKNLLKKYPQSSKLQGLVYKSALALLNNQQTEKEAKQRAKYDLHAYIRRQETYFKKIPGVKWLDMSQDNLKQIVYNIING
jgi:tRNA dimethylallyltransferase